MLQLLANLGAIVSQKHENHPDGYVRDTMERAMGAINRSVDGLSAAK